MLDRGLVKQMEQLGWTVQCPPFDSFSALAPKEELVFKNCRNVRHVAQVTEHVYKSVRSALEKKHVALTLGGDHSLGIGTVAGTLSVYPNAGVIWVDAHADINTVDDTESGNLHGCPVSFLMGLGTKLEPFSWVKPSLHPSRIVYVGLRDVDKDEKRLLKEHGILAFSMHHVDKFGIAGVMEKALAHLGDSPIHLSFDVDALDPSVAPATGTPVRGGLTFREGHYVCEAIAETGRMVSLDIMEVNPSLGKDELSLTQTVEVLIVDLGWQFADSCGNG